MSTIVLSVRALEERGGDRRLGPYLRAGQVFEPGWNDYVVAKELLETLQADPWLEVRVLDERLQAAKKMEAALVADSIAKQLEMDAAAAREKANGMLKDAEAALDAVGRQPPPAAPPPATPYQDAMLAATPAAERAKIDTVKKRK